MMQTIVVPIDGSEFSRRAVPTAMAMQRASGAGLRVVGVAHSDGELAWMFDHVQSGTDVIVDPDPAGVLLKIAGDPGNVLCFASHNRMKLAASVIHSVGSRVIEGATNPFLVAGANTDASLLGSDVVVALDGVHDPEPLLTTAAGWAGALHAPLRIVTVYEPVPADLRRPEYFSRRHGPPCDPDVYLDAVRRRVDGSRLSGLDVAPIPDAVGAAAGLASHLDDRSGLLLVVGGRRCGAHHAHAMVRDLLEMVSLPLLVVNGPRCP